ncbi:beta family protein [Prosthecobacter debontii]|uniref:beta family protein n=1 Tax=Prosthecobacter debontii TaxID=48467 RepID=UPI001C378BD7|nr:beta family protein [Prosthecobacter debontii]
MKSKAGELRALAVLSSKEWERMTPLIEIPPGTGDESKVVEGLAKSIPLNGTALLDFIPPSSPKRVTQIIAALEKDKRHIIPVFQMDDGKTAQPHMKSVQRDEFAVRIPLRYISANLDTVLAAFLVTNSLDAKNGHLILDLAHIREEMTGTLPLSIIALAQTISSLKDWKTLTIAGTAISEIIAVRPNQLTLLNRAEMDIWKAVEPALRPLVNRLDFGDYTITNPEIVNFDPTKMTVSPKILYATANGQWIVIKGRSVKTNGWDQTLTMCQQIVGHHDYLGPNYSYGSDHIHRRANGLVKSGASATWKTVGTNHHITLVADHFSTVP